MTVGSQEVSVVDSLYAKRETIHPRHVTGIFATLRVVSVCVLLGLYYLVPWISWNDRQAVLFDLPGVDGFPFGI